MEATRKIERRSRTREETRAFLCAYIARKEEFKSVRGKKFAMQNVLLDLDSQGVLSQPTTVEMLVAKFKNLVRAYKQSADNNNRTGATPCTAPFADLMDEIFGDSPVISNSHSIKLYGQPLTNLHASPEQAAATLPNNEESAEYVQQSKTKSARAPLKEKIAAMKIKAKKEIAEQKIRVFQQYSSKKLEKMEQAQQLKQKRHEEKMLMLKMFMQAKNKKM